MPSARSLAVETLFRVLRHHLSGRSTPLMATYFATHRCNLACPQCQVHERAGDEMTTGEATDLIGRLADGGLRRLGISGGEPFLRPDIGEIVRFAAGQRLFVSLFTNGTLLKDRYDEVRDVSVVMTSLDGARETHDAGRGAGTYDQTVAAIEFLRARNVPVIGSMALTTTNVSDVDAVLTAARSLGIAMIFHPIHRYFAGDRRFADQSLSESAVREVFGLIRARKREGAPVLNSMAHIRYVLDKYPTNDRTCYAGKLHFAILPDGTLVSCPHIEQGVRPAPGGAIDRLPDLPRPDCTGCFCYPVIAQDFLISLKPAEIVSALAATRRLGV